MKIVFYSTNCPRCKVLKTKLDQKKIVYSECNDVDTMLNLGIKTAPMLQVGEELYDFGAAVKWINEKSEA